MNVKILSKNNCPGCIALKTYLGNNYEDIITHVKLEENEEEYYRLVNEVGTTSVPTLILYDGDEVIKVVRGYNPVEVNRLFMEVE